MDHARSDAEDRHIAADLVEFHAGAYKADGKPIHAWHAYFECRRAHLTLPEWILEHLDKVGRRALRRRRQPEGLRLATYFHALRKASPKSIKVEGLARQVARRFDVAPATVFRAWERYKPLIDGVTGSLVK
jgi:hypothetical protein